MYVCRSRLKSTVILLSPPPMQGTLNIGRQWSPPSSLTLSSPSLVLWSCPSAPQNTSVQAPLSTLRELGGRSNKPHPLHLKKTTILRRSALVNLLDKSCGIVWSRTRGCSSEPCSTSLTGWLPIQNARAPTWTNYWLVCTCIMPVFRLC